MQAAALPVAEHRRWLIAGGTALAGHALALGAVMLWHRSGEPPVPEPVVLIDLPAGASAPAPSQADTDALDASQALAEPEPETVRPPLEPAVASAPSPLAMRLPTTPSPEVAVPLAAPRPSPARTEPRAPAQAAPAAAAPPAPRSDPREATGSAKSGKGPGDSPKAKKAQADYYAMIAAHLQRKKSYPKEAKKARQEGVVTVRFTVARDGSISNASIKRSSGHELLDGATLDLLRRVAPLPAMPDSMERESVTLALPIDYSLRTD
ncbi:energy transducer TonB [Novosphingobium sp. YJ-S2-02]|uniref:Protein TonB n=1 Tax=Novosphingobium aureum TaxID=2792964 RepID=A0A931HCB3_9SPHN|nr:energy transducer TonB [Novosphingobium aureum]MBH0113405.1 energy transducer TonB [Novosphingobium aureum]